MKNHAYIRIIFKIEILIISYYLSILQVIGCQLFFIQFTNIDNIVFSCSKTNKSNKR